MPRILAGHSLTTRKINWKYKNEKLTVACEDWYELLKLENSPEDKSEEKIQNFFLKNAVFLVRWTKNSILYVIMVANGVQTQKE